MGESRSESVQRVADAAQAAGLEIALREMPASTRTAAEAASACGCDVAQIVKSLIFQGSVSGQLVLLLVSGANRVDDEKARAAVGERLEKADARRVRDETGFAIGGVPPLGHLSPLPVFIDETLLIHPRVWAAGGGPQTVFAVNPAALADRIGARRARLT